MARNKNRIIKINKWTKLIENFPMQNLKSSTFENTLRFHSIKKQLPKPHINNRVKENNLNLKLAPRSFQQSRRFSLIHIGNMSIKDVRILLRELSWVDGPRDLLSNDSFVQQICNYNSTHSQKCRVIFQQCFPILYYFIALKTISSNKTIFSVLGFPNVSSFRFWFKALWWTWRCS